MSRPLPAAVLAALLSTCAGLAAAPLRVGGFVVAPLVMGEPGKPLRGALRDYLELEVVPAGIQVRWMPPTSLQRAEQGLRDGSLDVMLVASGEAARKPGTSPSTWTFLRTQPHLVLRAGSPLQGVRSLNDLSGLDIGWIAGPSLSPGLLKSGARWRRIDGDDWQVRALRLVQTGELDAAYFENEYSPRYFSRTMDMPVRLVRLPVPPRSFFMLYSSKANQADIARFDRIAGAAFAGRRFRDFLEKYPTREMAMQR